MKTCGIIKAAIIAAMASLSCSCSSIVPKEIDWIPINLKVEVQDESGKDLLDPENGNSWLSGTTIHFRGIVVDLDEDSISEPETKALPPIYSGFRLEKGRDCYQLVFGEFDGGSNYDDTFQINWPDGKVSLIHYKRTINNMTINAKQKWTLDGKECSNPVVIVK